MKKTEPKYKRLTESDRIQLVGFMQAAIPRKQIAQLLDFDPSTICRELKRGNTPEGYQAAAGQACARAGSQRPPSRLHGELEAQVRAMLDEDFSPEQVSGRLALVAGGLPVISCSAVYRAVARAERAGVHWRSARRRRPKRKHPQASAPRIPNRVGIEERPASVQLRQEVGHWEADLLLGARHSWVALVVVERTTRLTLLEWIPGKYAHRVQQGLLRLLGRSGLPVKSVTFDNGLEFYRHESVGRKLGCATYFCQPYHSWEKGTIENTNGLLRTYLSKTVELCRRYVEAGCRMAEKRLNNRPRKCLGYRTPAEAAEARQPGPQKSPSSDEQRSPFSEGLKDRAADAA